MCVCLSGVGGDELLGGCSFVLLGKVFDDSRCLRTEGRDELLEERNRAFIYNEVKFFLFLGRERERRLMSVSVCARSCAAESLTIAARLVLQTSYSELMQMEK